MPGILQHTKQSGIDEFVFQRDHIHMRCEFEQWSGFAPVTDNEVGHRRRGAVAVFFQHDDLAAEADRREGGHVG